MCPIVVAALPRPCNRRIGNGRCRFLALLTNPRAVSLSCVASPSSCPPLADTVAAVASPSSSHRRHAAAATPSRFPPPFTCHRHYALLHPSSLRRRCRRSMQVRPSHLPARSPGLPDPTTPTSGRSSSLEERDISRHHPLPLFHVRSAIASFSVDLSAPLGCRFASVTIRIDDLDQKRGTQATTTALFSSPSSVLHCSSPPSSSRSPRRLGTIGSATRTHELWGVGANRWLGGREGEARAGAARLSHQSHDDGKAASTMARDELT